MKILSKLFSAVLVIALLWLAVSTIEIMSKNTSRNPEYSDYNLWSILMEVKESAE